MFSSVLFVFEILFLERTFSGFSHGMIRPGKFEYSSLNGWMKSSEAAELCEKNLLCGGFTFHGTLNDQLDYEVFFFHYVAEIMLDKEEFVGWDWTSYTVNR